MAKRRKTSTAAKKRASKKTAPVAGPPRAKGQSHAERVDEDLALVALRKTKEGKRPTRIEAAALDRVEERREREIGQRWVWHIPKSVYKAWAGGAWENGPGGRPRPDQTIDRQHDNYGLPAKGATVSLPEVIHWLHDFLAENSAKLSRRSDEDDDLMQGEATPALERYRAAKADLAELELQDRRSQTIDRAEMHEKLAKSAATLRRVGEDLERTFGVEALEIYNDGIADAMRALSEGDDAVDGDGVDQPEGAKPRN